VFSWKYSFFSENAVNFLPEVGKQSGRIRERVRSHRPSTVPMIAGNVPAAGRSCRPPHDVRIVDSRKPLPV
jgi:hypothetical protein